MAYYVILKRFFWTQIFTRIFLVFPLQAVSISQTECHMAPHLTLNLLMRRIMASKWQMGFNWAFKGFNNFTINSHNTVYKQHSC
jgi:hypothetical protein